MVVWWAEVADVWVMRVHQFLVLPDETHLVVEEEVLAARTTLKRRLRLRVRQEEEADLEVVVAATEVASCNAKFQQICLHAQIVNALLLPPPLVYFCKTLACCRLQEAQVSEMVVHVVVWWCQQFLGCRLPLLKQALQRQKIGLACPNAEEVH